MSTRKRMNFTEDDVRSAVRSKRLADSPLYKPGRTPPLKTMRKKWAAGGKGWCSQSGQEPQKLKKPKNQKTEAYVMGIKTSLKYYCLNA